MAIFPHIDRARKDDAGSEALNPDGLVPNAIRTIKEAAPNVGVICDVALDPFTTHGHDGVLEGDRIASALGGRDRGVRPSRLRLSRLLTLPNSTPGRHLRCQGGPPLMGGCGTGRAGPRASSPPR